MQKLVIPFLLPPLLSSCTAFQPRSVQPEIPALVFVDGQISESADIITQTQHRIAPPAATPVPVRQTTVAPRPSQTAPLPRPVLQPAAAQLKTPTAPASKSLQTGQNTTLPGLSFSGTPSSVAVLSLTAARNLTLEQWVRRIIPSGWTLNYENALRPALSTRIVSVDTNDQWTRVLSRLLTEQSISGQVDWNSRSVTLRRAGQTVTAPVSPAVSASVTTGTNSARDPFSNQGTTQPSVATSGRKITATPPAPVNSAPVIAPKPQLTTGQPVAPVITGKSWLAPSGTTLREMLLKWAQETRCESGASPHWTVIWPLTVTDYRLDAPLTFRGSFESMLGQMFDLYRTAQKPLYAEASRVQCVVSVSDTPATR